MKMTIKKQKKIVKYTFSLLLFTIKQIIYSVLILEKKKTLMLHCKIESV